MTKRDIMNQLFQKRSAFIIKSILWSMLFYSILMLAFNWDDVSTHIKDKGAVTTANDQPYRHVPDATISAPLPVKISGPGIFFNNVYLLVHTISGM